MKVDNLFNFTQAEDVFGEISSHPNQLNTTLIDELAKKPHDKYSELEVAKALLELIRDELVIFGTSGGTRLDGDGLKSVLRTAKIVLSRNNLPEIDLPFRDFDGFYDYWRKEGMVGGGSWGMRRGYIQDKLNPAINSIEDRIDAQYYAEISNPVSELPSIGDWQKIKDEITQLRNRYATAKTYQDFNAVGTACVRIIEGLSRVAYNHSIHGEKNDTAEPPIDKTNIRIGRVIEVGLSGRKNAELRALAKSSSEVAHRVKHANIPDALQAGLACDATILLASIVQRIEQARSKEAEV